MKAIPSGNTTLKQNVLELLHEPQNTVFSEELYVVEVIILAFLFLSILAATLPVPTGVLIPSFKMGAAFGRMVGEAMALWFPHGIRYGPGENKMNLFEYMMYIVYYYKN